MKLSILDQSPISSGKTAQDALLASKELAIAAERLGYTRYWIAEHHHLGGLASSNPSVMLSYIGAHTKNIRLGAGAVLLPHYRPYFVAETYHLLATLFPDRIDLGIGRAPGGSAEAAIALSGNFLENVKNFPDLLDELLHFIYGTFPKEHMYSKVSPTTIASTPPQPWLLGTSERSGILAAKKGLPYTFGHFMTEADGPSIIKKYRENFVSNKINKKPHVILTISVICAETTEEAEEIAWSNYLWKVEQEKVSHQNMVPTVEAAKKYKYSKDERELIQKMKRDMIVGSPNEVKKQILLLQEQYDVDEVMIVTITHSYEARLKSYELIAKEFLS